MPCAWTVRYGRAFEHRALFLEKPKAMDAVPRLHGLISDLYELTDAQLAILNGLQTPAE